MRDVVARWWAHRKLRRGQCGWCGKALPDDSPSGYVMCSPECSESAGQAGGW